MQRQSNQIPKTFTRLTKGGLFATTPEYPEFVWNEIIVNAVAHRDYSIKGTDIHIKMFDDKIVVESPGTLPGLVRLNNIRSVHFSRNPKIAGFLKDHKYVKEFGEGIDRMYNEMEELGLPEPEYSVVAFMTKVAVKNNIQKNAGMQVNKDYLEKLTKKSDVTKSKTEKRSTYGLEKDLEKGLEIFTNLGLSETQIKIINEIIQNHKITQKQLAITVGINERNIRNNIEVLKQKRIVQRLSGKIAEDHYQKEE